MRIHIQRASPIYADRIAGLLLTAFSEFKPFYTPAGFQVYIRSMAILPAQRGRGTATQLLTVVHAYAVSRAARRLVLSTTPFLTAAIRVHEKSGFHRIEGDLDLHGTPLFAMVKELNVTANRHSR